MKEKEKRELRADQNVELFRPRLPIFSFPKTCGYEEKEGTIGLFWGSPADHNTLVTHRFASVPLMGPPASFPRAV